LADIYLYIQLFSKPGRPFCKTVSVPSILSCCVADFVGFLVLLESCDFRGSVGSTLPAVVTLCFLLFDVFRPNFLFAVLTPFSLLDNAASFFAVGAVLG
jgi:hypothetical protein